MIESGTIIITEIDDVEIALEEFQRQMPRLRKNSVGIVSVHSDYFETGVYDAIVELLPFPVLGTTTISQSSAGVTEMYLLSILVLTSDDCVFATGVSDEIPQEGDVTDVTASCYNRLKAELPGPNKLSLLFVPLMTNHYSYKYVSVMTGIDGNVPVFGTISNEEAHLENGVVALSGYTLYGAEKYTNRLVMLLISGDITPRFYLASIGVGDVVLPQIGQVTKSNGNIVQEINGVRAGDFFNSYGYSVGDTTSAGLLISTLLIDHVSINGTTRKVGRALYRIQNGDGMCLSNVPEGSIISIAYATPESVMATTRQVIRDIKQSHSGGTALIYSCMGRRYALLSKPLQEFMYVADELKDGYNYMAAYSNGEVCPVTVDENCADNQEHNHTIVACIL